MHNCGLACFVDRLPRTYEKALKPLKPLISSHFPPVPPTLFSPSLARLVTAPHLYSLLISSSNYPNNSALQTCSTSYTSSYLSDFVSFAGTRSARPRSDVVIRRQKYLLLHPNVMSAINPVPSADTPITIKVTLGDGDSRRIKVALRDLGPNTLPEKVRSKLLLAALFSPRSLVYPCT